MANTQSKPLRDKVALVAGATRGAGRAVAVELARAGAAVYATGRSSRVAGPSEVGHPETIEETGELITAAGGDGILVRVDHLQPDQVRELIERIDHDHGQLDDVQECLAAGAREFHIHVRDADGNPALEAGQVDRAASAVRAAGAQAAGVTTVADIEPHLQRRLALIGRWTQAAYSSSTSATKAPSR